MKYYRIGDYLKYEFLEKYELSENMLALALDVLQSRINEIVRHRRGITANTDLRLCKFFKLPDGHFINLQTQMELEQERSEIADKLGKILPIDTFKKNFKG